MRILKHFLERTGMYARVEIRLHLPLLDNWGQQTIITQTEKASETRAIGHLGSDLKHVH